MFEVTPSSPLSDLSVDFRNTKFPEPLEADEQGGFQAEVTRFELGGSQIRDPGVAIFLPQRWPFTDVDYAQVSEVRLHEGPGLRFSRGRMIIEGRARYDLLLEGGEKDVAYMPIRGALTLSPTFRRRLQNLQSPPPESFASGFEDREEVLVLLQERVGGWGKALVQEALEGIRRGESLSEDVLRGLRHRLYKTNMREEVDMFRTACLEFSHKPSPKRVAMRFASAKRSNRSASTSLVAGSSSLWLSWISQPFTTLYRRSSEFVSGPVDDAMDNVIRDLAPMLVASLGEREIDEDVDAFESGANHGRHDARAGQFRGEDSSWEEDYLEGYHWGYDNALTWTSRGIPNDVRKQVVRENMEEFRGQVTEKVVIEALGKAWHAVDPRETVKAMLSAVKKHGWKVGIGFALFEIFEHSVLPVALVALTGRPEAAIAGTLPLGEIIIPIVLRAIGKVPAVLNAAQPDGHLDWYIQNFGSVRLGSRNPRRRY